MTSLLLLRSVCVAFVFNLWIINNVDAFEFRTIKLFKRHYNGKVFSVKDMKMSSYATVSSPARTFMESVNQASVSTRNALLDGHNLVEVEFPPLPLEYLEDSSSSASDIAKANTRWAIAFGKTLSDLGKVTIIYPDKPELDDAIEYVGKSNGGARPYANVTLATIRSDSISNARSIDQIIGSIFGATVGGVVEGIPGTKLYVAVVSSTQELTDIEKLHLQDPSIPIVFFNLRLDVLKGDLGLPLFPGRDLQYRFLSRIKTAYLLRSRAFATTLRKPPFIINYSGVLFRAYPEIFQTILNVGDGKTRVVSSDPERPTTAKFRDNLVKSLKIPGVNTEELRTKGEELWWEKDEGKEQSREWRT